MMTYWSMAYLGVCAFATNLAYTAQDALVQRKSPSVNVATSLRLKTSTNVAAADSLPQDSALTVGTLPNGMQYYLRTNKSPANRAELRLVVNAGSILEDPDQLGFAHFLEHMAFNGTRRFPHHALTDFVEDAGMQFGADLNASTSFDETIYMLTIPTDDPRTIVKGLDILEDWANGGISIDSAEVVAERGVVLSEWRSRLMDTASESAQMHVLSALYGPLYASRLAIGDPNLIKTATPAPLERFYRDWYRPDLMAIVAVGDFDKTAMEQYIRDRFGRIPAPSKPRPRPSHEVPSNDTAIVDVYPSLTYPVIRADWKRPMRALSTEAALREAFIDEMMLQTLQRRFLALRKRERRPFVSAETGRSTLARSLDAYTFVVVATPDSLESAFAAMMAEVEQIAQHGLPPAALDHQKISLLRSLESNVDAQRATTSRAFADVYVAHYLNRTPSLMNAEQTFMLAKTILPTITPETIAQHARFWRDRKNLLVQVVFPKFAPTAMPTPAHVLAMLDSVANVSFAADPKSEHATDGPLLTHPPTPGSIVHERRFPETDVTEWTLSNGARVLFKSTQFDADELYIRAVSLGGFSLVPDSLFFSPGRLVAKQMNEAAGLGTYSRDAVGQQLSSTVVRSFDVSITNSDESITIEGAVKDAETLSQLLYLQFTAPTLDSTTLAGWKQVGADDLQPSLDDMLTRLLARGNPRKIPVSPTLVSFADVEKSMAIYKDRFGDASDFTFLIVGAISPETARSLAERYIATLPSTHRTARERSKSTENPPWSTAKQQHLRTLPVQRSQTLLVFDGLVPSSPDRYFTERWTLDALAMILRNRLRNELRERLGGTYSPQVSAHTYADPEEHYRFRISFDAEPDRMPVMLNTLFETLDSVRLTGATAAELQKVARTQQRRRELQLQDNRYWLMMLQTADRLGLSIDQLATLKIPQFTSEDLRGAARTYLSEHAYIHLTNGPADTDDKRDSSNRD